MSPRLVRLVTGSWRDAPALDTGVSRALLQRVGEGSEPETLRLFRPEDLVAFGPKDRLAPGFPQAVEAARRAGFGSIERLAGGRAAVFHEATLAFAWVMPDPTPRQRIRARFEVLAEIMATAFRQLGVEARVGAVAGEYCPGEYSVNARGRTKLMGVGQRVTSRAAHVGGVVVVGGASRVRDVLIPVYAALDIPWDPSTVGSLEDEVGATYESTHVALVDEWSRRYQVEPAELSSATLELAHELAPRHAV